MGTLEQQIVDTTEVRRHNGQCEYGEWIGLASEEVPEGVRQAITDEIGEAMYRDDQPGDGNTGDRGTVKVGGQAWIYRR